VNADRSLRARNRAGIRGQPLRLKENQGQWKRAELASGKKTERAKIKYRRLPGNKAERKRKAEKLVCRSCGSDDLAPNFIKRHDRRCRKCFSKRNRSAKPAKKQRSKEEY